MAQLTLEIVATGYAAMFTVAAVSKLDTWAAWRTTASRLVPHARGSIALAAAVPAAELTTVMVLAVAPRSGILMAAVLCAAFVAGSAVLAFTHTGVACNCFGALTESRFGPATAVRNLVLALPSFVAVTQDWSGLGGFSAFQIGAVFLVTCGFMLLSSWLATGQRQAVRGVRP